MAKDFLENDVKSFWKKVKNVNNSKSPLATCVDGQTGDQNIVNMWQSHYKSLLNSVKNVSCKAEVVESVKDIAMCKDMIVTSEEVKDACCKLKSGKSCGPDKLPGEAFKFADPKLYVLLALCFSSCFVHGYLPVKMIVSEIVPIVKNRCGNTGDKNNYRPVALANVSSKLFEMIMLTRLEEFLWTCDNQFGFKKQHSTDLCIYTLREFIEYFKARNTTVFVTFLDASQAFDRLNHWILFKKLVMRGVDPYLVRIIMFWYSSQQMYVR